MNHSLECPEFLNDRTFKCYPLQHMTHVHAELDTFFMRVQQEDIQLGDNDINVGEISAKQSRGNIKILRISKKT